MHERSFFIIANSNTEYFICQLPHSVYQCPTLMALSVPERIKKVVDLKLCKLCLRPHVTKKCYRKNCFRYFKPHNTLLQLNRRAEIRKPEEGKDNADSTKQKQVPEETFTIIAYVSTQLYDQVLLSTGRLLSHFGIYGHECDKDVPRSPTITQSTK